MDYTTDSATAQRTNDYYIISPTEKQISYALKIASLKVMGIPDEVLTNRFMLSRWIDANKSPTSTGRFSNYPSSKQVSLAERIARLKRSFVPHECFRDRKRMSRWIDDNR